MENGIKFKARYKITGTGSSCSSSLQSGSNIITSCSRTGKGLYTIYHNLNTMNYILVIIGEKNTDNSNPTKISLYTQTNTSFSVASSDDDSENDAAFWVTILVY